MLSTSTSVAEHALNLEEGHQRHAEFPATSAEVGAFEVAPRRPHTRAIYARVTPNTHYASPGAWKLSGRRWIAAQERRRDWQDMRRAILEILTDCAREDGTSAPTWSRLVEETGASRRTVARALKELVDAGWLAVHETGSTDRTRPSWSHYEGNRAAVYGLLVPATAAAKGSFTCSGHRLQGNGTPLRNSTYGGISIPSPRAKTASGGGIWPSHLPASTGPQRLALATTLQRRSPWLRKTSDRALRSALRPWLENGWTLSDLLWALDHAPDGTARWHTAEVRCPTGWVRARLRPWVDLPAPSVVKAAERAAADATQQRRRAERAAAEAAAVPMPSSVRAAWRAAQQRLR